MTIRDARILGSQKLKRTSSSAALDAEILLAHALGFSREELLTHDNKPISTRTLARYRALLTRRAKHEPIAYITGHKQFYGLDFKVDRNTLIPRPETELTVELALNIIKSRAHYFATAKKRAWKNLETIVIDVGTGSGAIAVAVAKNAPTTTVIATDVSAHALKLAKRNAFANDVADRIVFRKGNLIKPVSLFRGHEKARELIITSNLPYLTTAQWRKTMTDVRKFEPRLALDGGKDGLRFYDELLDQIASLFPEKRIELLCEIDPTQKKSFPKLVQKHFPHAKTEIKNDLAGLARVALVVI